MISHLRRIAAFLAFFVATGTAWSQAYPAKAITIIVPYGAGGGTDTMARYIAEGLSSRLKQSVIIENIPGAGGTIAVNKAMNSPADGYVLAVSNGLEFEMQQMASGTMPSGKSSTLTPIALIGTQSMVLVARPDLGFKSVGDLIAYSKANPGKLALATSGPGTSLFLAGLMFEKSAGIETLRVPYKSAPQIINDLIGKNVDVAVLALPSALTYIQNGQLIALATTDAQRTSITPDLPSLSEYPDFQKFDTKVWYALQGPPGLPSSIAEVVGNAVRDMQKDPQFMARMESLAVVPAKYGTADEFVQLKSAQYAAFRNALGLNK
ncbi:Bug family tripartite tricarboxylate transporter substrate binding protein [Bordetella pseudohinzii]|uniref:Tripartite tricarboxylate transporter family receptor n=3 Tax=Bordetella pseudohinzii TaxID=1331258 RepID=A0A0M7GA57_9BORD|nr:tripartite tricarboxylate transporter substrate binding protein [Bordetella pseudohinzii]CUI92396.1 Tripartite tricarboxylate transporter family receptor [Bordetella pseudohinzii]